MRIKGQPSGTESVWMDLRTSFSEKLGKDVRLRFPSAWSPETYRLFQQLEGVSFRPTLRYTEQEMLARLKNPDVLLMYVMSVDLMEGVLFCYAEKPLRDRIYYLDTVAVRTRGIGLGKVMMHSLIAWAREKHYKRIRLDTEELDENGHHLAAFYSSLGFAKISEDMNADVTMELVLE
jgi:GNAT superfamily N-acetyltransferase